MREEANVLEDLIDSVQHSSLQLISEASRKGLAYLDSSAIAETYEALPNHKGDLLLALHAKRGSRLEGRSEISGKDDAGIPQ